MEDPMLTDEERATLRAARDIIDKILADSPPRVNPLRQLGPMPSAKLVAPNTEGARRAQLVMDCHSAWVDLDSGELAVLVSQETEGSKYGYEGYVAYRYAGKHDVFNDTLGDFVERFEPKE